MEQQSSFKPEYPFKIQIIVMLIILFSLANCKIVKIKESKAMKSGASDSGLSFYFENENFDPDQMVNDIWDSQVMPYMVEKAVDITDVANLLFTDQQKAGEQFGTHRKGDGEPWCFVITGEGMIKNVDTTSRVGKLIVEIPSLKNSEIIIQIGPVIKESSIRDSLDFISFDQFVNQIEFANLSNAFNKMIVEKVIGPVQFDQNIGRKIKFYGAFTMPDDVSQITITPVKIEVEGGV